MRLIQVHAYERCTDENEAVTVYADNIQFIKNIGDPDWGTKAEIHFVGGDILNTVETMSEIVALIGEDVRLRP